MKAPQCVMIALVLSLGVDVVAQENTKPEAPQKTSQFQHSKTIQMFGKISEDGTKFVEQTSQRVWLVKNIKALKGFQSQLAVLRCRIAADSNLVKVLSITPPVPYPAHWSDSAFRR
jgi:hypothetical protein